MMIKPGDVVHYNNHPATVIHVFDTTANIRLTPPVKGLSRQMDVYITSLRAPYACGCWSYQHLGSCIHTD